MSYIAQPISIISYHKFITPPAISTLRDFSLSQNRQPILAQPYFHTLYKSGQCSPKHKLFSNFWCHMTDETFSHIYIMKNFRNVSQFLSGRLFKSVNFFLRLPVVTRQLRCLLCSMIICGLSTNRYPVRTSFILIVWSQ